MADASADNGADCGIDLRPLNPEEAEIVASYPLPEGVPDAILNKWQLAQALDTSDNTVTAWVREGMPVEEAGTNGRNYSFRLSLCWAWRKRRRAEEESERRHAEGALHQLKLALIGDSPEAQRRAALSAKEYREELENDLRFSEAARRRGELIFAQDVIDTFEAVLGTVGDALDALPDRVARDLDLDGSAIELMQRICDDARLRMKTQIGEIVGDGGGDGSTGGFV